jgi:hypothetical protein
MTLLYLYICGLLVALILTPHLFISIGFIDRFHNPNEHSDEDISGSLALASLLVSIIWPLTIIFILRSLQTDIEKGSILLVAMSREIKERKKDE